MPLSSLVERLERFPLPNFRMYILMSIGLHIYAVYYAMKSTADSGWRTMLNEAPRSNKTDSDVYIDMNLAFNWSGIGLQPRVKDVVEFLVKDYWCLWVCINSAFCSLAILASVVQHTVFGKLRPAEKQKLKENFWRFLLYKFIFIFGVIKVQFFEQVIVWIAWYSVLGFLQLLTRLCADRLNHLNSAYVQPPFTPIVKITVLLSGIFISSCFLTAFAVQVAQNSTFHLLTFMCAECFLLKIRMLHALLRYAFDRINKQAERRMGGIPRTRAGQSGIFTRTGELSETYYLLFSLEVLDIGVEIAHYVHLLLWGGIFLSMASLAIIMNLHKLFVQLKNKIKRHRTYVWVMNHMEKTYPLASPEELQQNSDNCAVCWEPMEAARKLPCSHLFHVGCLQQWLEQDTSCPTCRFALNINSRHHRSQQSDSQHFFRFNGSRYISWLPSFSVEVMHSSFLQGRRNPMVVNRTHLEAMARQIQNVFPSIPLNVIMQNLRETGSVDVTVDNILEGRVYLQSVDRSSQPRQQVVDTAQRQRASFLSGSLSNNSMLQDLQNGVRNSRTGLGYPLPPVIIRNSRSIVVYPPTPGTAPNDQVRNSALAPPEPANENQDAAEDSDDETDVSSVSDESSSSSRDESVKKDQPDEEPVKVEAKFLPTSREREQFLRARKEMLINKAKRSYLQKSKKND